VRYYGKWMRDEAERRIGHLYPKGPNGETVIAWLWARTVRCPNPACGARMPLVRSFDLSKKKGKKAWVEPVVDRAESTVSFKVIIGEGLSQEGTVNRRGATCIVCGTAVPFKHVRAEGKSGRMSQQLMAVVVAVRHGRDYLAPTEEHVATAEKAEPSWRPEAELPHNPRDFKTPNYGLTTFADLFTPRQLIALTTFSDLVGEAWERAHEDAVAARLPDDSVSLNDGGKGAQAYADAVATYLGMALSRLSDICNAFCPWEPVKTQVRNLFGRQAIAMSWNFAEPNVFAESAGDYGVSLRSLVRALENTPALAVGRAKQVDAASQVDGVPKPVISTDPPYYDNIGYADLSDFFYVWLRRSLGKVHPGIFSTMLVPKSQELVATPYRFGGSKQRAQEFFEEGLGSAFARMRERANSDYPITVYYAFKQAESEGNGSETTSVASTGWETMLEGLLATGFQITGTWPMRTELTAALKAGFNNLASSIVLVCRPRPADAPPATRQEFVRALRRELPDALSVMMAENVAPVDLAQATIGPGMAIYSRYSNVVEADGSPMRVRTALQIINQALDEHLSETEGDMDSHTRFAITWFEQHGMGTGPYPDAEGIAKARNVSVRGVQEAGILEARAGKVSLLPREKLTEEWDPATDGRLTDWEIVQHLIRALETEGEMGAARLLARIGERGEGARDLAYRLYGICERKKWAEEALAYNGLVVSWPEITRLAAENPSGTEAQTSMDI
jgi:putative DNA methylase